MSVGRASGTALADVAADDGAGGEGKADTLSSSAFFCAFGRAAFFCCGDAFSTDGSGQALEAFRMTRRLLCPCGSSDGEAELS